jgi:hypothetical protein
MRRLLPRRASLAVSILASLFAAQALAQPAPPMQRPGQPEVTDPPTEDTTPPADPSTGGADPSEPLSEQLKKGEGVLEPPRGIDPEIRKPIPDEFKGTMPVIPPPGEPGGTQDVQPN